MWRTLRTFVARLLWWFVTTALDPVVFVSVLGPLAVGGVLLLVRSKLYVEGTGGPLLTLLAQLEFAGIVDYILQFYAALVSWALVVFRLILRYGFGQPNRPKMDREDLFGNFFLAGAVVAGLFGFYMFFGGGAADRQMVEAYASQATPLGEIHWPLLTKLFWLRAMTAAVGIASFYVHTEPAQ